MIVTHLTLQSFRSYKKATFAFKKGMTAVVGRNAIGKTNLLEALFMLSNGRSFRTEKDKQLIRFDDPVCRITGVGLDESDHDTKELEVVLADNNTQLLSRKYLVNGVSKRRVDFAGFVKAVLFTPSDLELIAGQPGIRRRFLDDVLEQVDFDYRQALTLYTKALRQRNALLERVQETGFRDDKVFLYWDNLLITNGQYISQKRDAFITACNQRTKEFFEFELLYDKSEISIDRLLQYRNAEAGAGLTLVGPHRDDVQIVAIHKLSGKPEEVRFFASRGQQRLVALELKLAQAAYITSLCGIEPMLLLDDIFSELDEEHITQVLQKTKANQIIMTTTHKEFLSQALLDKVDVIEL